MIRIITGLFPLWAILFSTAAYLNPSIFTWMKSFIVQFLMVIMFSMGVTLTIADFKRAIQRPKIIGLAVLLQYFIMPLAAFLISKLLGLSTELMIGMVLVGSVSGGTASNVICYLGKADVALSITMTMVSTLLAVAATPFLTWLYLGTTVPVPVFDMLFSLLNIVFVPVILGVVINTFFHKYITAIKPVFPLISMLSIVTVIAVIVGINQAKITNLGLIVVIAVVFHNIIGLIFGYATSRCMGYDKKTCRTVAIEVGMQNSGLGVALAIKYFSAISALPGAIFSIWHNLSGSLLASYWSTYGSQDDA